MILRINAVPIEQGGVSTFRRRIRLFSRTHRTSGAFLSILPIGTTCSLFFGNSTFSEFTASRSHAAFADAENGEGVTCWKRWRVWMRSARRSPGRDGKGWSSGWRRRWGPCMRDTSDSSSAVGPSVGLSSSPSSSIPCSSVRTKTSGATPGHSPTTSQSARPRGPTWSSRPRSRRSIHDAAMRQRSSRSPESQRSSKARAVRVISKGWRPSSSSSSRSPRPTSPTSAPRIISNSP